MNTMNMPGFTGEVSLYVAGQSYCGSIRAPGDGAATAIVAQQDSGCTVSCSEWTGCNNKCGEWPPGLSNYQCWLDCLKPSIDCLQRTCGPPLRDCTTTGCPSGKPFCCDCVSPAKCTSSMRACLNDPSCHL
jgi:hypothetical protein